MSTRPYNFKQLDYLHNRRLVLIQKSQRPFRNRLQVIGNEAVDDFILTYHEETRLPSLPRYSSAYLLGEVQALNQAETSRQFSRILERGVLRKDTVNRLQARMTANNVATVLTNVEVERIQKNVLWTERVMQQADINIEKYSMLANKLEPTASRKAMIEKCLENGTSVTGREYTYKEMKNVHKGLAKYQTNKLDLEAARMENWQAIRDGNEPYVTSKTWIWSTLENTRHENMDNQTVPLDSKFEVLNEVTGEVDYLMFPGDIENENHNCSNTCNCMCSYTTNKE